MSYRGALSFKKHFMVGKLSNPLQSRLLLVFLSLFAKQLPNVLSMADFILRRRKKQADFLNVYLQNKQQKIDIFYKNKMFIICIKCKINRFNVYLLKLVCATLPTNESIYQSLSTHTKHLTNCRKPCFTNRLFTFYLYIYLSLAGCVNKPWM